MTDPGNPLVTVLVLGIASHAAVSLYWRVPLPLTCSDWRTERDGFKPFNCEVCVTSWLCAATAALYATAAGSELAWSFLYWLTNWFMVQTLDAYLPLLGRTYPVDQETEYQEEHSDTTGTTSEPAGTDNTTAAE